MPTVPLQHEVHPLLTSRLSSAELAGPDFASGNRHATLACLSGSLSNIWAISINWRRQQKCFHFSSTRKLVNKTCSNLHTSAQLSINVLLHYLFLVFLCNVSIFLLKFLVSFRIHILLLSRHIVSVPPHCMLGDFWDCPPVSADGQHGKLKCKRAYIVS